MRLSADEIRRVAALAHLELTDAEAEALAGQLGDILERVDRLDAAGEPGTADDGATAAPRPEAAPLRPDDPGSDPLSSPPADWAPGWRDGFFTVPRLSSHGAPPETEEEP